ncbi:bifunctional folylpolyglutamate synthase/dihydrofolate synthase [Nafulsella turpanensis]|uniref:bifunctional folylpolyglutamate synthase/dihydrofolate synthase n=1 Tax=Nafulsella turpanensis TaxID=1265690 RepID=UPI00034D01D1|nr:folylpolyglutamate synthase/dihydrofolate synthase family protein [Nafulsella turpanensis]
MNYQQTLDYLYGMLPMYQRIGQSAFKKDLSNTIRLCEALDKPEKKFRSVHVAGTNGKGSSAHAIASVLQESGYKTGLYTSPHLKNFTERIRINGQEIAETFIVAWVAEHKHLIETVKPSFFELTVALAFDYFASEEVDVAVIEVGMGGRLDSTNVIIPEVSLITNIGLDHMAMLGNTLAEIAGEKAGIIKKGIPVVIGQKQEETTPVYLKKASELQAPLHFAGEHYQLKEEGAGKWQVWKEETLFMDNLRPDIKAAYFIRNLPGVFKSLEILQEKGYSKIASSTIKTGLAQIVANTGLKGRWQVLGQEPMIVADVSHNPDGILQLLEQLRQQNYRKLHIIIGTVNDKDIQTVLCLLPKDAFYYFCQANIPRALAAESLEQQASRMGLEGKIIPDVNQALKEAHQQAQAQDLILITGSTFVVAEIEDL